MHRTPALLALILALVPAGCGDADEGRTVALVTNSASDFWSIARKGAEKAAAELGVTLEYRVPDPPNAAAQQRILEELSARGVGGVAISPKDPANQVAILDRAAGSMHLITVDSDAPGCGRPAYVGTDNVAAGRAAGREIRRALPDGGDVVLFVGDLEARNARERRQGILEELEGTGVRVTDTRTDNTDRTRARRNAEEVLVNQPDVRCLVGLWSYNGPAVLAAVEAWERAGPGRRGSVQIVCFDEEPETLRGVAEGRIRATIVQRPFEMGYHAVRIVAGLLDGDRSVLPEDGFLNTGIQVVDAGNVEAFRAALEAKLR